MIYIKRLLKEEENQLSRYILNYPFIDDGNIKNNFIDYINMLMYEDVLSFKDALQEGLSIYERYNYIMHGISEYRVSFNNNNIISIPIEFSQLIGLYDISYINCYNYDLNLEKEILIEDVFDKEKDYISMLDLFIKDKLKNTIYNNKYITEEMRNKEIEDFNGISKDQSFYIDKDGVVICFSSYEIGSENFHTIELKLEFEECEEYLSAYTISNICT